MRSHILLLGLLSLTAAAQDPPGALVDIGGRRLHIHCTGSGSPAVILEAGAGSFAIDWNLVQPGIARGARVCSYDRAGLGWSDRSPKSGQAAAIVDDLHSALAAAGVKPPYVMVGASMGGIYVRLFDLTYPGEVAGMVLVDPTSEDRLFTMFEGRGVAIASLTAEQLRSTIPDTLPPAPPRPPQTGAPFDRLAESDYKTRVALESRSIAAVPPVVSLETRVAYAEAERSALARLHGSPRALGDRPLIVLTRSVDGSQALRDAQAAVARLSTNSRQRVVPDSGHEIHLFQPEAVVRAVGDVVAAVKNHTRLAD